MEVTDSFQARGHPSVRSTHKTTLMFTTDEHLTTRGDCIIAIEANKGLRNLDPELRNLIKKTGSSVTVAIEVKGKKFKVRGEGHSDLELSHPSDMVIRKSRYICNRTLMIGADYAAIDISKEFVRLFQDPNNEVSVTISAHL